MLDATMCVLLCSNFVVHQDGALVHIAFKTVQLLQCKMPNFLLPDLYPHNGPAINFADDVI